MKILVAGGTGFVGTHLVAALIARGDDVHVMSRYPAAATTAFGGRATGVPYGAPLDGYDAVINLAGAGIADKRWTEDRKRELLDSRTKPTTAIASALAALPSKPKVLVNASAIGFYGDRENESLDETSKAGIGFLPDTCKAWEESASPAIDAGIRVVLLRIGVVLGDGGALKKMIPPFKMFVGGNLGSGKQWMSWIHVTDLVRMIIHCVDTPSLRGPVNGTAPEPATNAAFSKALGRALGRPSFAPVPGFMLKLLLGEMATMLLGGQKVLPKAALASGFKFEFPDVDSALKSAIKM